MHTHDVLLVAIVTLAFATETAIGFGATLITVALGSLLLPIDALLFAVVPLNLVLSLVVAFRERAHIDRRLLFVRIAPAMALGFPLGVLAFARLPRAALQLAFGLFVLTLGALELLRHFRARTSASSSSASSSPSSSSSSSAAPDPALDRPLPRGFALALLFLGGVVHGAFATGGPPVVYVCGRTVPDKRTFRGTLAALWLALNGVLLAVYAVDHKLDATTLRRTALLAPGLALGLLLGELAHGKIPERRFRLAVFAMLVVVGAVLALRA